MTNIPLSILSMAYNTKPVSELDAIDILVPSEPPVSLPKGGSIYKEIVRYPDGVFQLKPLD